MLQEVQNAPGDHGHEELEREKESKTENNFSSTASQTCSKCKLTTMSI